jgi:hypothetical protein
MMLLSAYDAAGQKDKALEIHDEQGPTYLVKLRQGDSRKLADFLQRHGREEQAKQVQEQAKEVLKVSGGPAVGNGPAPVASAALTVLPMKSVARRLALSAVGLCQLDAEFLKLPGSFGNCSIGEGRWQYLSTTLLYPTTLRTCLGSSLSMRLRITVNGVIPLFLIVWSIDAETGSETDGRHGGLGNKFTKRGQTSMKRVVHHFYLGPLLS